MVPCSHSTDTQVTEQSAIVFGGAGFIGRHLLTSLARRGFATLCADIQPLDPPIPGVRAIRCDVRDPIPGNLAFELSERGHRIVTAYNLAAVHRTPGHQDREYYDTNVSGAINITEFCREAGIRRLVFTSSISVYGPSEEEKSEDSLPRPESSYGASKLQAEAIHRMWQRESEERRLVIARPAVVFGPGENGNFTRLARALRRGSFLYPGRRDTIKACGYVDELVASFEFALSAANGYFMYNFCYPQAYTIESICEAFHEVAGFRLPIGMVPFRAMWLAAAGLEGLARLGVASDINRARVDKLVRSTRIRPNALIDAGYKFRSDLSTALAHWGESTCGAFR